MSEVPFLKSIKENWVVLAFLVSLVVSWTTFNTRLASAEAKIDQLSEVVAQINEIRIDIAVIQADVRYIKTKVQ